MNKEEANIFTIVGGTLEGKTVRLTSEEQLVQFVGTTGRVEEYKRHGSELRFVGIKEGAK